MASKVKDVIEGVKDAIFPDSTYKTTVKKFGSKELFLQALVPGDQVTADESIAGMPGFGIAPASTHEIEKLDGKVLVLKGGKRILAEWFVPEVRRRERIRRKADRKTLLKIAAEFAAARWAEFKGRLDAEIKAAEDGVVKAQVEIERAQNRLKQAQDHVLALRKAKIDDSAWSGTLAEKLMSLVDQKLFTNYEWVREGEYDVLVAYTGPIMVRLGPPPAAEAAGEQAADAASKTPPVRGEYALKIYPTKAKTKIVIENVGSGKLPTDVPFNESRIGVTNVCFGELTSRLETLVRDEDWVRALIMVRAFIEGNRTN